jgi:multidrug resistance efflux pump
MDLTGVRYWYEDLEPFDKVKLAGILAAALVLLVPWRTEWSAPATVKPLEGELAPVLAPGTGYVREMRSEAGKLVAEGDLLFTYAPQADPVRLVTAPTLPGYTNTTAPYQDEERQIRDRYRVQVNDAYAIITSTQQQLNRTYSEQNPSRRNSNAYDIQLAQNAVTRAQAVPGELSRKMEAELAVLRNARDSSYRLSQFTQSQVQQATRTAQALPAPGEVAVAADGPAWVWSTAIRPGARIVAGQECALLLPEGARCEVTAALPAAFAKDLRPALTASLEILTWMHDAENVALRVQKVGNRNLDKDEVKALLPNPPDSGPFVLVTFRPAKADSHMFPPPRKCEVHVAGVRRCLLQRILF